MWKKWTAILLAACMLLSMPVSVSFASNAEEGLVVQDVSELDSTEITSEEPEVPESIEDVSEPTDEKETVADVSETEKESEEEKDTEVSTEADVLTEADEGEETVETSETDENKGTAETSDTDTGKETAEAPETDDRKETEEVPGSADDQNPGSQPENEEVTAEIVVPAEEEQASEVPDETDFTQLTVEEQYSYLQSLNEDEIEDCLSKLSAEEIAGLKQYVLTQEEEIVLKTVTVTDAGPFLPPVKILAQSAKMRRLASGMDESSDGLYMSKTAEKDGDNYKIRLEVYTDGVVTTETKSIPTDIVLVLDQSGSMAYNFAGESTNTNSERRQYAMKEAVNQFIDSVAEKYSADSDHRLAIVTFGSDASQLRGWTYADNTGRTNLKSSINGLPSSPSGATNIAAGMTQAETLMNSGYSYNGANTERNKVVIVFTDGVPTTSTDFSTNVATNAIKSSKNLKDEGVTIYSIGIFAGADPSQLYGEKWDYAMYPDISCTGEVGTFWGGSWAAGLFGGNDFDSIDVAAGNRFLNYLSTNYKDAEEIGITRGSYNPGNHTLGSGDGYRIDKNFERTASDGQNYYLTASDSNGLNEIFEQINSNISTPSISLGSQASVKDIISPYFELSEGANADSIRLYTANCTGKSNGEYTFAEQEQVAGDAITVSVDGQNVSITGFDFDKNFVSEQEKEDKTHGKKLIIEFSVQPKEGFLGGNEVPTNGAESGLYNKDNVSIKNFEQPKVDVPIKPVTVTAPDKNVYLLDDVTGNEMKAGATVKSGDVSIDLSKSNYGLESWQYAYVNIEASASPEDDLTDLTEDTEYTVSCTVSPKADGSVSSQTGSAGGKINVYKPVVTFKDSKVYYGGKAPENPTDYDTNNLTGVKWMHGTDEADTSSMGSAPELENTYSLTDGAVVDGKINTKNDIPVNVTTAIGETEITEYTTYDHQDCVPACGFRSDEEEFLLHVGTCELQITKNGGEAGEKYVFHIKKDGEDYMSVVVAAGDSITIKELPEGTYYVSEDTGWSWRYEVTYENNLQEVTVNGLSDPLEKVVCTNQKENDKWLTWTETVTNVYGKALTNPAEGGNE